MTKEKIENEIRDIPFKSVEEKRAFLYDLQAALPNINYRAVYSQLRSVNDIDLRVMLSRDRGLSDLMKASVSLSL